MIKLFLRAKLLSGSESEQATADAKPKRRNRRVFERFAVDHKHLTMMNEQDILLIREISSKGFSTEVSARGASRVNIGDVYEARVRYLGESYDLNAKVTWKTENSVGFEIVEANRETVLFLKRLLRPIEIANSLREIDSKFMLENESKKIWYHGDEQADLYIWLDRESGSIRAWQLAIGTGYAEWNQEFGLVTGDVICESMPELLMSASIGSVTLKRHGEVDPEQKQLAVDILVAFPFPIREQLLATLAV
jgi:hypothetical protein